MLRITRFLVGGSIDEKDIETLVVAAMKDGAYLEDVDRGDQISSEMIAEVRGLIDRGKCLVFIQDSSRDGAIVELEHLCSELRLETLRLTTSGGDEEPAFIRRETAGTEFTAYAVQDGNNLEPALTLSELNRLRTGATAAEMAEAIGKESDPGWIAGRLLERMRELEMLDLDVHPMPPLTISSPAAALSSQSTDPSP